MKAKNTAESAAPKKVPKISMSFLAIFSISLKFLHAKNSFYTFNYITVVYLNGLKSTAR